MSTQRGGKTGHFFVVSEVRKNEQDRRVVSRCLPQSFFDAIGG